MPFPADFLASTFYPLHYFVFLLGISAYAYKWFIFIKNRDNTTGTEQNSGFALALTLLFLSLVVKAHTTAIVIDDYEKSKQQFQNVVSSFSVLVNNTSLKPEDYPQYDKVPTELLPVPFIVIIGFPESGRITLAKRFRKPYLPIAEDAEKINGVIFLREYVISGKNKRGIFETGIVEAYVTDIRNGFKINVSRKFEETDFLAYGSPNRMVNAIAPRSKVHDWLRESLMKPSFTFIDDLHDWRHEPYIILLGLSIMIGLIHFIIYIHAGFLK